MSCFSSTDDCCIGVESLLGAVGRGSSMRPSLLRWNCVAEFPVALPDEADDGSLLMAVPALEGICTRSTGLVDVWWRIAASKERGVAGAVVPEPAMEPAFSMTSGLEFDRSADVELLP